MNTEEKEKLFLEHIENEDALQIVVRGHLHLENELINLLSSALPQSDCLDPSELRFPIKVKMAGALGLLRKDSLPVYLKFNSLRNKFAHNLNMEIDANDIEVLISSLSKNQSFVFWGEDKEERIKNRILEKLRYIISILFVELTKSIEDINNTGYIITNGRMGKRLKKVLVNYNLDSYHRIDNYVKNFGLDIDEDILNEEDYKKLIKMREELERED